MRNISSGVRLFNISPSIYPICEKSKNCLYSEHINELNYNNLFEIY